MSAAAVLGGAVAQAQTYGYAPPRAGYAVGPADPCARNAANRRLGWGLVGAVLGGFAGSAVAAAGVAAEGAALGALVGGITGGRAGARSAACGTAALTGQPIVGVTPYGVAIYGPMQPAMNYPPQPAAYPAPAQQPAMAYAPASPPCCWAGHAVSPSPYYSGRW